MTSLRTKTGPRGLSRLLLAVFLTTLAGCAGEAGDSTSSRTSEGTDSPGTDAPATQMARSVTVTSSGGLTGERTVRRIDAEHPLAGEVLPLTADRSIFAGLSTTATPPCCDHISYKVVVDYASGRDYSFLTWNGADVPAEVDRLVAAATG